jgi:hypothetical protein
LTSSRKKAENAFKLHLIYNDFFFYFLCKGTFTIFQ